MLNQGHTSPRENTLGNMIKEVLFMCFYSRTLVSLLAPIHTLSMTYDKGDNKNRFHWSFPKSIFVSQNIFKHKRLLLLLLFKNMDLCRFISFL